MNVGILIAVLVYEVVIILGVGLWLAKREAARVHGEGDFALAGRHLPVPVIAITLALMMIERGFGRMVFLASDAARVGQARLSYYAAAKGGVIALVKSVAQEVGQHGITMNVVSPGAANTELRQAREAEIRQSMGDDKYAAYTRKVVRRYPMGRVGEPDDVAGMIAYLVSARAAWTTGQVISVNGGFVMP